MRGIFTGQNYQMLYIFQNKKHELFLIVKFGSRIFSSFSLVYNYMQITGLTSNFEANTQKVTREIGVSSIWSLYTNLEIYYCQAQPKPQLNKVGLSQPYFHKTGPPGHPEQQRFKAASEPSLIIQVQFTLEDNLNGRRSQWKTSSMEDDLNGR